MLNTVAILPAFNEEISIGSAVIRTQKFVDHVIVIDDGSDDGTSEIALLAGAQVIKHTYNQGKDAALKTGFKAANGYEIIITLYTNGKHNPADIPKFLAPIRKGEADIVNGSRYLNVDDKKTPFYKGKSQNVPDNATYFKNGIEITDTQSGFRAFAKHTIPAFKFNTRDWGIECEMIREMAKNHFKVKEVEIGARYNVSGSTKSPIRYRFEELMQTMFNGLKRNE